MVFLVLVVFLGGRQSIRLCLLVVFGLACELLHLVDEGFKHRRVAFDKPSHLPYVRMVGARLDRAKAEFKHGGFVLWSVTGKPVHVFPDITKSLHHATQHEVLVWLPGPVEVVGHRLYGLELNSGVARVVAHEMLDLLGDPSDGVRVVPIDLMPFSCILQRQQQVDLVVTNLEALGELLPSLHLEESLFVIDRLVHEDDIDPVVARSPLASLETLQHRQASIPVAD